MATASRVCVGVACVCVLMLVTASCHRTPSVCAHYPTCAGYPLCVSHRDSPRCLRAVSCGVTGPVSVCLSHTVTLCVTQVSACLTATQNPACVTPRVPQRHVRVTTTPPHTPQPCSDSHGALRSAASRHPHATAPCARQLGVCVGGQTAAGGSGGRERRLRPCPAGLAGSGPARQRGGRRRRR